jgi:NAD(P)-dependent dehydrogenase (short-subunit alcohol dehydrogenase family)
MPTSETVDHAPRDAMSFAERYGPWAVVAGASEGVGAAFARGVAERGVSIYTMHRGLFEQRERRVEGALSPLGERPRRPGAASGLPPLPCR